MPKIQRTKLLVEVLEARCVPAGTVTIDGWGAGNINITGDGLDNQIGITGTSNGLQIDGLSGTTLALGPSLSGSLGFWVVFSSTSQVVLLPGGPSAPTLGQLYINMLAGHDRIQATTLQTPWQAHGNIIILPGDGNDAVVLGGVTTQKALLIRDHLGNDLVQLDAVSAHDPSFISLGANNDQVRILGSGTVFDDDLTIWTGAGSDLVRFSPGQSLIKGDLVINTTVPVGDGGDTVLVDYASLATDPHTLAVLGNTQITTGDGADVIRFGLGTGLGPSADLGGTTNINMGNQNDRIFASRVIFNGVLTALLGAGNDQVLNNWGAASVSVAPGSVLNGGPPPPGLGADLLPAGWTAPAGLSVVGFP